MAWIQGTLDQVERFQSTKIVRAMKIVRVGVCADLEHCTIFGPNNLEYRVPASWMAKHDPLVGDYLVFYSNGYVSYSPASAFEEGYLSLDRPLPIKIYRTGMTRGGVVVSYEMAAAQIYGVEQIFNHKWQQCGTKYLLMSQDQHGEFHRHARVVDARLKDGWESVFEHQSLLYGQVGQMWVERVIYDKKVAHVCSQTEFYDVGASPPEWFDSLGKRTS